MLKLSVTNRRCNMIPRLPLAAADEQPSEGENSPIEDIGETTSSTSDKIAGRKKRLELGYQVGFILYLVSSVLNLVRRGFQPFSLYYVFGGGSFTVSMLLYILKGAASNDRLSSDTYKRLNLSVIGFALLQLLLPVHHWIEGLVFKLPAFVTLVNGVKGYGYGVLGWDKSKDKSTIMTDIKIGMISIIQGAGVVKQKSIGYVIGTAFLGVMTAVKALELLKILILPSGEAVSKSYMVLSRMSRLGRLGIMTTIMYTLKDASDRDRLTGTTFVQLGYLMTVAFLTMSFYLSPVGPTLLGVLAGGLSALTFYNGVTNAQEKKG